VCSGTVFEIIRKEFAGIFQAALAAIAGFGEGTPQQDSDGTERAKCEIWHHGRILLSAAPNLPSLYNGHFFGKKQGMYL